MKGYEELLPINYDTFYIWLTVNRQMIISMNGVVDLNHVAVWKDIDEYEKEFGLVDRWNIFKKIISVFNYFNENRNEEYDTEHSDPLKVANKLAEVRKRKQENGK